MKLQASLFGEYDAVCAEGIALESRINLASARETGPRFPEWNIFHCIFQNDSLKHPPLGTPDTAYPSSICCAACEWALSLPVLRLLTVLTPVLTKPTSNPQKSSKHWLLLFSSCGPHCAEICGLRRLLPQSQEVFFSYSRKMLLFHTFPGTLILWITHQELLSGLRKSSWIWTLSTPPVGGLLSLILMHTQPHFTLPVSADRPLWLHT